MKLNTYTPNIETSGFLYEKTFGTADLGMIFDILRSKLYSNPILAVAREISCNARDAHREVGTPEVPVTIVLPNQLDCNYRIKDLGPGISPERMENIFINYAASTKRGDNIQTGAFGLGSKSPWAVSDTFNVITVHQGIKYQYTCFIDETKVGKIILHLQEPTTEPNGTEIVIPVEPKDIPLFNQWTEHACRHWEVKPTIKGGTIAWAKYDKIMTGKNWDVVVQQGYRTDTDSIKAIVDGIEYPLSYDALRTYTNQTDMIDSLRGVLLLYFGVGELSLSANREQVYLDEKTQQKINERLQKVFKEVKQIVDDQIDAFPDLWQANIYYRKQLTEAFNNLRFLGSLKWKDIPLHSSSISLGCPIFTFSKGKYLRRGGFDANQINRSRLTHLSFDPNYQLYISDLPIKEPTTKHVKKAFEDDPNLKGILVVSPTDKITQEVLNEKYHLDKMQPKRLSSITKVSKRTNTPASSRLIVFKYDTSFNAYRQVSYASIEEDANNKVICLLGKNEYPSTYRFPILKTKQSIDHKIMGAIVRRDPETSFYGVDMDIPQKRLEEEFGDCESLDDYLDRQVINNASLNYVEIKYAFNNYSYAQDHLIDELKTYERAIKNKNSPFLKRARLYHKIKELNSGDISLLPIYETVKGEITDAQLKTFLTDHPDYNLTLADKAYQEKYPLLAELSSYQFRDANIKHIAQYVNLIDTHG